MLLLLYCWNIHADVLFSRWRTRCLLNSVRRLGWGISENLRKRRWRGRMRSPRSGEFSSTFIHTCRWVTCCTSLSQPDTYDLFQSRIWDAEDPSGYPSRLWEESAKGGPGEGHDVGADCQERRGWNRASKKGKNGCMKTWCVHVYNSWSLLLLLNCCSAGGAQTHEDNRWDNGPTAGPEEPAPHQEIWSQR